MATTLHGLKTYYSNIMRADFAHIPPAHQTLLADYSARVDAGTLSLSAAQAGVARLAIDTTSVATLAYNFFTGAIPYSQGLDYLVSPTGPNPNNLNSPYYQSANIENRYINFAVNLGKLGEGGTRFTAGYGALSLGDTVVKAYTEIFGGAPDTAKVDAILNMQVPNGLGGTYTRAEYFAFYGRDGATGIGTKAALVGWLMAEAEKLDGGVYAAANAAFLADLGPDGVARFHSELVSSYGAQPAFLAGATIAMAANQSVSPDASNATLRSTANADSVTGSSGLDATQSIVTAAGADAITIEGTVAGLIDAGAGNDVITVGTLNAPIAVLGVTQNGAVLAGAGDDTIIITIEPKAGAVIDGGAGDDTLDLAKGNLAANAFSAKLSGMEHLVLRADADVSGTSGVSDIWAINTGSTGYGYFAVSNIAADTLLGVRGGASSVGFGFAAPVATAHLHLDGIQGTPYGHISRSGFFGFPDATNIGVANVTGSLYVHVDRDSAIGQVSTQAETVFLLGAGSFTGAVTLGRQSGPVQRLDATQVASADISNYLPNAFQNFVSLSAGDDLITVDLQWPASSLFTLGPGADTFRIATTDANRFNNLHLNAGKVDFLATITDFGKGVDKIDLGAKLPAVAAVPASTVGAATSLEQALVNVSPQVAANAVGVFEYAGDTYIYRQDATIGVNNGDGLIRLVGAVGLTVGTGTGLFDIHYG